MQSDQTGLSLRPGGGNRGGSRVLGPRFDTSLSANSDLPLLRPHGGSSALSSFKVDSFLRFPDLPSVLCCCSECFCVCVDS